MELQGFQFLDAIADYDTFKDDLQPPSKCPLEPSIRKITALLLSHCL